MAQRPTQAESAARRTRASALRSILLERSAQGESVASLAREYQVHHEWLANALDTWASARGINNHRTRRYPRPRAQCEQNRKSVVDDRTTVIRRYLENCPSGNWPTGTASSPRTSGTSSSNGTSPCARTTHAGNRKMPCDLR